MLKDNQRTPLEIYESVERQLKIFLEFDQKVEREDTCTGLKSILNDLKSIMENHNNLNVEQRLDKYHLVYNAIVYTLDVCRLLRKSQYAFEAVDYLLQSILTMEANLILQDAKYLDLRTKLYIQVAHIYEEQEVLPAAYNILATASEKITELLQIHESDPPVPEHIKQIIQSNLRLIKVMLVKYRIQSGVIAPADWRKKVDEQFAQIPQYKLVCLVECLRTRTPKQSNMFEERKSALKQAIVNAGYELVKGDLTLLCTALEQQKERIQRIVAFKTNENLTQEMTNEEIKKRREFQDKLIKEKDYMKASQNVPLQYHCQLVHYAFEVRNAKVFQQLSAWATTRIKCRRIEVKYITDINILPSTLASPNIPNEYQKLPFDLNQGNLRLELAKLRNSGRTEPAAEKTEPKEAPAVKEPPKKGGKEPPPVKEEKDVSAAPTKWELEQIKHKYVYLLVKRSMNPDKAIFGIDIVMGHEEHGPVGYQDTRRIVVPYIQANASVKTSQVDQYTGVQATSHLVPYIILYHSKDSLTDETQRKSIITDIKPVFGKHPMVRPEPGYIKIPVDLRQVPEQFIRQKHHDYIYLSYKTDNLFNINQRHTQILIAFNELEQSFGRANGLANTTMEEKQLELDLNYDINKMEALFQKMQSSLAGVLGEEYYSNKTDFLTQLLTHLWIKYLRSPLSQFDYVFEQRLAGQIIDYDWEVYRDIMLRVKPIFKRGLKILHLILVENSKADMLLLCKINLQLTKLLEQDMEYRIAIDNLRFCLERLQTFRNNYLRRGLQGKHDQALPLALTCSNMTIAETMEQMKQKYKSQKQFINRQLRINSRKANKQNALSTPQLQQEEFEFGQYQEMKEEPELKEYFASRHKQFALLIAALHSDMLGNLYRIQLKEGERLRKIAASKKKVSNNPMSSGLNASGFDEAQVEPLAASLKQKIGLMYTKSQVQNRKNLHDLQTTLQKAGQLQPPPPSYQPHELKLIQQAGKNPYALALLKMNLAGARSSDKEYLLMQSLKLLKKAKQEEQKVLERATENSIFVLSAVWDNRVVGKRSTQFYPFKHLYDGTWPSETDVPTAPILVGRTSNSISLKMQPHNYPIGDPNDTKNRKKVVSSSVYGKISANGVGVSTNCTQLTGTGLKQRIDTIVNVRQLNSNNYYCFACASTDDRDELGPIGKTGQDIGTYLPLPLNLLYGYLARIAFQLGQFNIAKEAAMAVLTEFCQPSGYINQDGLENHLYYYRWRENALYSISLLELRWLSETLIIGARCLARELQNTEKDKKTVLQPLQRKQMQDRISNLLILSSSLSPVHPTPNRSLCLLLPQQNIVEAAMLLSSTPTKFMSPRLRMLSFKVMLQLLRWGLQNNEVALARRIAYRWGDRRWMMLGKLIQVQEKKQAKKGKEAKEQEVKMIEKYVRMLVEKSPEMCESYLDGAIILHEDYSDYMSVFIERIKEQITNYSQYVDNPPEQVEKWINQMNNRLDMIEYLKDPIGSLAKIPNTIPSYLESISKLLRRALEFPADFKQINDVLPQIKDPQLPQSVKLLLEMHIQIQEAVKNDIDWAPENLPTLKTLQEKTGQNLSKPISIFQKWVSIRQQQLKQKSSESLLAEKNNQLDYVCLWMSELSLLKATSVLAFLASTKKKPLIEGQCYYNIWLLDLEELMKRVKEREIMDKNSYVWDDKSLEQLDKILKFLCSSAYFSLCIESWSGLQNAIRLAYNLLVHYSLSPFNHWKKSTYQHFTFISLTIVEMLKKIKKNGYHKFKNRSQERLVVKEIAMIESKLKSSSPVQTVIFDDDPFEFSQPRLDTEVSKKFWWRQVKQLDVQLLSNFIAYTVQCLRIEEKHRLLIGLVREFSNATQHKFSLLLLPFLIDAQQKLLSQAQKQLNQKNQELTIATEKYQNWRKTKKKSRQAELSGEKPKQQQQFEQLSQKLNEARKLLQQKVSIVANQQKLSRSIIEELRRDSNQASLMQKQQHRILLEVGAEEARIHRKEVEQTKLSRNRKNTMLRDLINKYSDIFRHLRASKTTKDTLSEIQNLHEVGNLYFAIGNLEKATEYWNDSLATILQTVNPITTFREIMSRKGPYIVQTVGLAQSLLAINLLVKLAWTCFHKNLHIQRESMTMAAQLIYSMFRVSSSHPMALRRFATYRLKAIKQADVFQDQTTVNLSELLYSCQYISWSCIDNGDAWSSLPVLTLMDYVATDVVKSSTKSMRSKLLKSIALSQAYLLRQSHIMLLKAINEKDMPFLWIRQSEFVRRQRGSNWFPNDQPLFNNSNAFSDINNKQVIESIKKMEASKNFQNQYGFLNSVILTYARALLIMASCETEVFENIDINEQRCQYLIIAEGLMRDCLRKLSMLQEFYQLLAVVKKAKAKLSSNQMDDGLKKKHDEAKSTLIAYLKAQSIDQATQQLYLNQQSSNDIRADRIALMMRIRNSISRVNQYRNMWTRSFHVLKYGLFNLYRYSNDARQVETGYEKENEDNKQAQPAAKKDDKKGKKQAKEQTRQVKEVLIDQKKEEQLRQMAEARKNRTTVSAFWHLKLEFQLGRLLYRQNRHKEAISILSQLKQQSEIFQQKYFSYLAQGYILRSRLKLGHYNPSQFEAVIQELENSNFIDFYYIELLCDYAQTCKNKQQSHKLFEKATKCMDGLSKHTGLQHYIKSRNDNNRQIQYCTELQLPAEAEEQIKLKKKTVDPKKGGKDDKKQVKKDDKKKKDEPKQDYKIQPLNPIKWFNLNQEQRNMYQLIDGPQNSNELEYNCHLRGQHLFIRCHLRQIRTLLESYEYSEQQLSKRILKLQFLESIISRSQNIPISFRLQILFLRAMLLKQHFLSKFKQFLQSNINKAVRMPFEDMPLNNDCLNMPAFQQFLKESKNSLEQSAASLKKLIQLIKGECVIVQFGFKFDEVYWQLADVCLLLAEYQGRVKPLYYDMTTQALDQQTKQFKINQMNLLLEANKYLQDGIKVSDCRRQLCQNYGQIGKKAYDSTAKIDQDIVQDILQTDYMFKKEYASFDESKKKITITYIDLLTAIIKAGREGQHLTFSVNLQNTISKCHRFLLGSLSSYKQKCVLNSVDVVPRKDLSGVFVETTTINFRPKKTINGSYIYLYILGAVQAHKIVKETSNIIYGRVNIGASQLSKLSTSIFNLKEKMAQSDKKTPAQKQRDYRFHIKEFEQILIEFAGCYVERNNPKGDLDINTVKSLIPELNHDIADILISMWRERGVTVQHPALNVLGRYLHTVKYGQPK